MNFNCSAFIFLDIFLVMLLHVFKLDSTLLTSLCSCIEVV